MQCFHVLHVHVILIASSILDDAESRTHRIAMDWLDGVEPHLRESMESLGSEQ